MSAADAMCAVPTHDRLIAEQGTRFNAETIAAQQQALRQVERERDRMQAALLSIITAFNDVYDGQGLAADIALSLDQGQAALDASKANLQARRHPSSDGLRALADWLDQRGGNLAVDYVGADFKEPSPEALAQFVELTGAIAKESGYSWVNVVADICGVRVRMTPYAKSVATVRKVMREVEEVVLPGAAS